MTDILKSGQYFCERCGKVAWGNLSSGDFSAAAALDALEAEIARLREALTPFGFLDYPDTQSAWECMYRDRFKDWIDFENLERARAALQEPRHE